MGSSGTFRTRPEVKRGSAVEGRKASAEGLEPRQLLSSSGPPLYFDWANVNPRLVTLTIQAMNNDPRYTVLATLAPTATAYADTSLSEASGRFYKIGALGSTGIPSLSDVLNAITIPAAPTGLNATASATDVTISWTDHSQNEDGFEIFRSIDGTTFTQIDDAPANVTSYEDYDAPYGGVDYYYVKAVTAGGESAASNTASANLIGTIQTSDDTPATGVVYEVTHGKTLTATTSVLANDSDPNGLTLSIASHTNPAHGTLTLNSDGTFTYVAASAYVGLDSFTYTAADSLGAGSTTGTVDVQVDDQMPQASSSVFGYGTPVSGQLEGGDGDGDPITYSVVTGPTGSQGTFTFNSSSGLFTFTRANGYTGAVNVVFKVNDGLLDSNLATESFQPYDSTGGNELPTPGGNQEFSLFQNGTAASGTVGALGGSADHDTISPDPDSPLVDSGVIEQPKHGTLSSLDSSGRFVYQPTPGFVGRDWFTVRIDDGSKQGGYSTFFLDVTALPVSLNFDGHGAADPTVLLPPGPQPGGTAWTLLDLSIPAGTQGLPTGTTVTLSADLWQNIDVWNGQPGGQGSTDLFGKDPNLGSHTWTVGTNNPPSSVYVVGITPTDYDQVVFHLNVTLGPQVVYFGGTIPTAPPNQPLAATQLATVPGQSGSLAAFDGTWDYDTNPWRHTAIADFKSRYSGTVDYKKGVGNQIDHPVNANPISWLNIGVQLWSGAFGGIEATAQVNSVFDDIVKFYQTPANRRIPLDIIGYSRGAFEAAKLANMVVNGIQDRSAKYTTWANDSHGRATIRTTAYDKKAKLFPWIRFVGLISPVNQMGPLASNFPTSIPNSVGYGLQVLDGDPNNFWFPQTTMTHGPAPRFQDSTYPHDGHPAVGVDGAVITAFEAYARGDGVPV